METYQAPVSGGDGGTYSTRFVVNMTQAELYALVYRLTYDAILKVLMEKR